MTFRPLQRLPFWITVAVIGVTLLVRVLDPDFVERIERVTYDLRVRTALRFDPPVAANLGFVVIDDDSVRAVRSGELGYKYGLYWPRQVYGRLVEELAAQGAAVIAFDVVFGERRPDHPLVQMADGALLESDEFLAVQLRRASNVILAATSDVSLPALFLTNACALGDIATEKDPDGVLRRVRAFRTYHRWHPVLLQVQADPEMGIDLRHARVEPGKLILLRRNGEEITVPLDAEGDFELADFVGNKLPRGMAPRAKPFTEERVWHMGIVIAARELQLDLNRAEVDLPAGRIVLRGPGGVVRRLPVDREGYFLIDWCLSLRDARLYKQSVQALLAQDRDRLRGVPLGDTNAWRGKLAIIGSAVAGGNDLTDQGATPLLANTLLVSKHWNVANSVITGRFIYRLTLGQELILIVLLGAVSALLTWRLRVLTATASIFTLLTLFVVISFAAYIQWRVWVPLVIPCVGALLATHACLITWRVIFEQTERRRVKSVFSKIVSPNVVHELLQAKTLALGGARREVTVFFADVRGFTEFTDASQDHAARFVREHQLTGAAAEAYFDEQAREILATVNLYLSRVADTVKQHNGTLDKYIGDCVMAFWGAPTTDARHALGCVRAAMDAQRAIHELNEVRAAENQGLAAANQELAAAGRPLKLPLPLLSLGTGVNTGVVTVGLMGSDAHIVSYTVFGREVNLASRLEGVSGRGRIIVSETTYQHLCRDDAALASRCVELPAVEVKGIRAALRIFEVPWR